MGCRAVSKRRRHDRKGGRVTPSKKEPRPVNPATENVLSRMDLTTLFPITDDQVFQPNQSLWRMEDGESLTEQEISLVVNMSPEDLMEGTRLHRLRSRARFEAEEQEGELVMHWTTDRHRSTRRFQLPGSPIPKGSGRSLAHLRTACTDTV
jgi:hypothetical protein